MKGSSSVLGDLLSKPVQLEAMRQRRQNCSPPIGPK